MYEVQKKSGIDWNFEIGVEKSRDLLHHHFSAPYKGQGRILLTTFVMISSIKVYFISFCNVLPTKKCMNTVRFQVENTTHNNQQ